MDEINKEIEIEEKKEETPYDKNLLDADEEYVRSSRRGSIAPKIVKKKKGSHDGNMLDNGSNGDYDYDFDNEHFQRGSFYTKRDQTEHDTQEEGYALNSNTRIDSSKMRATSLA